MKELRFKFACRAGCFIGEHGGGAVSAADACEGEGEVCRVQHPVDVLVGFLCCPLNVLCRLGYCVESFPDLALHSLPIYLHLIFKQALLFVAEFNFWAILSYVR